ncbi:NMDA receptor synaptonuclear signaling and neuronal migration factor isoform X2 [Sinocyclocheilus rhinocerous]|uniref:NMDA receptor synaptonuclear signaling and neuronal migration factor isoform X2 n=1 Tax=Sinocyclocheilus rhinocerous TaxID=307959 RepID=UPI0007B9A4F7|nr:PREDICTED: NMDA receptor synaptonuclear signaling and neuronal migration factor-like isoform X2 [Sinocyclocheilus rhinocerous]
MMRFLRWQPKLARVFGEYLHTHPENRNGSDYLLSDTLVGHDSDSPDSLCTQNNNFHSCTLQGSAVSADPSLINPALGLLEPPPPATSSKSRLSLERSFSAEEDQQKCVECSLQPARAYTITGESGMLGTSRGSKENLELEVLKGAQEACHAQELAQPSTSSNSSSPTQHHHRHHGSGSGSGSGNHHHSNHHHGNHHHSNTSGGGSSGGTNPHQHISSAGTSHHHHGVPHPHHLSQPLQSSVSAHNIRGWGEGKDCGLACEACPGAPSRSQGSLDLESSTREAGKQRRPPLEQMCSVDRMTGLEQEDNSWFPKENMFSFQTATTTMQAISVFRSLAEKKRRKNEMESASIIQRNFRKHLRMVGSRRMKAQTFAERRAKSFNRSWSDPTPVKQDSLNDSKDSGDLQTTCGTPEEGGCEDMDWEEEREMERLACEGDDFIPPKIMLISSKVPKAEYVPNIIRRGDTSIIPILYDHEHATFDDILEEIEKRLTAYRRGCKIWRMLIFCQGGPGHLYLLKNKVATFAKVEKEEDMSQFWKRLSRFMSKVNPEPNLIHIMGCYVLGNPNGEKLFQKLKNLMRPYSVTFESPLELSAQGKEMIEMYFDFRLFRLWKTRQHSKLLDYEDLV